MRAVENIRGFQCKLTTTPGIILVAKRYPVPTIDLNEGDWDASFQVPSTYTPIAGKLVYFDDDDPVDGTIPCLDTPEDYDFRLLLTQGPVANDAHTWGAMKALYR